MKTWNIYCWDDYSLLDVVTSTDDKESWDVKTWWWETSPIAARMRERESKLDPRYDINVDETPHFE